MSTALEWWPDYGHGPLVGDQGVPIAPGSLGLDPDLVMRLDDWGSAYSEDKLPMEGNGEPTWIAEGIDLLAEVRAALTGRFQVVVTEPWWGEEPTE